METKQGVRTSEFWVTMVGTVSASAYSILTSQSGLIVVTSMLLLPCLYIVSRIGVKNIESNANKVNHITIKK